jgi:hypothetical protein
VRALNAAARARLSGEPVMRRSYSTNKLEREAKSFRKKRSLE